MPDGDRTGTQAIERTVNVVRHLAERGSTGWRLSDLAERVGLPVSTTHRILSALVRERLAVQLSGSPHYSLGPLVGELAASLPGWMAFPTAAGEEMAQLARRSKAVAFLFARSGSEFVCLVRAGSTGIMALSIEPGTRRPLATSAGGAAILVAMERELARRVLAGNLRELAGFHAGRLRAIRAMVRLSFASGFGLNPGIVVPNVHAFGVAITDARGEPIGSVTVAGPAEDLPMARIEGLLPTLRGVANRLAGQWPVDAGLASQ